MKKKSFLLLLVATCCMLMSGCSLYENIDEEVIRCPQTENPIDPSPWEPQPNGGDSVHTGH